MKRALLCSDRVYRPSLIRAAPRIVSRCVTGEQRFHASGVKMEDFRSRFEAVSRRIAERQQAIQVEIRTESESIAGLQRLQSCMREQTNLFDAEDETKLIGAIQAHITRLAELERLGSAQETLRKEKEDVFAKMYHTIEGRRNLLEDQDGKSGVLGGNKELLTFFAQKQVELQRVLKERMSALGEEFATDIGSVR